VQYARQRSRWGIETSIIVPGAFTSGTNHFTHSGKPADEAAISEYDKGPSAGFGEQVRKAFAAIVPPDADASAVADAIVQVVNSPSASDRSACTSIRPRMEPASASRCSIASALRCSTCRFIGSAETCSTWVGRS
jgi:hypothetical protein